ncbi:hypothetical protein BDP27DRAFT_189978 [Rhodocollybia butyracea]|uniref:Fork-head domain-containing protein n=1 Tax=Rhodocollybia butyracea TaxID=206335 RepID=A0A9P5Q519_9AGAR|nr:hypothetical protein BDP27DRAFT_189978 [Rhodocollybia butyracea]
MNNIPEDVEVNLAALPDIEPGQNGPTLATLVQMAIVGSPNFRLLLREIFSAIEERYPSYRTGEQKWKGSIRHMLSLKGEFIQIPRPITDFGPAQGKGNYWSLDMTVNRDKRTRKRRGRTSPYSSPMRPDPARHLHWAPLYQNGSNGNLPLSVGCQVAQRDPSFIDSPKSENHYRDTWKQRAHSTAPLTRSTSSASMPETTAGTSASNAPSIRMFKSANAFQYTLTKCSEINHLSKNLHNGDSPKHNTQ